MRRSRKPAIFSTCMRGVTASGLGRCLRPEGPRPYNQQMPRIWKMPRRTSERSSCRISKRCCAPRMVYSRSRAGGRNVTRPTEGTDVFHEPELDLTDRSDETRVVCPSAWMILPHKTSTPVKWIPPNQPYICIADRFESAATALNPHPMPPEDP